MPYGPYMSPYGQMPFMMPMQIPTFLTIGSQRQGFRRGFFGESGGSKNFFMTLGR